MSFVSYAQNQEDVVLWRALHQVGEGFYIDVGANHPEEHSVTSAFYERGWKGINIEPVDQWFRELERARPRDTNLQVAVGADSGFLDFYEVPGSGLSTSDVNIAERHRQEHGFENVKRRVALDTLTRICDSLNLQEDIHFLKIDVEGAERAVLEGFDLERYRPWIILVESTEPLSQTRNHDAWEQLILDKAYSFVYFDGLNRYYLAVEHAELGVRFDTPPNVFDDFVPVAHFRTQQKCAQLETEVAELRAQNADLVNVNREIDRLGRQAEAAKVEALEAELRFQKALNEHLRQRAEYEKQSLDLQRLQRELHDSLQNAHHWWCEAQLSQRKLSAIEHSTFWRITEPMRAAVSRYRHERNLKHAVKHFFRPAVVRSMRLVIQHPRLGKIRRLSQDLLAKQPRLRETLRRIAANAQLIPGAPSEQVAVLQSQGQVLQLSQLPMRAQQIYHALKAANDRRAQ